MKHKLINFIIALALSISLLGSASAVPVYSDTAHLDPWAKEAVDFVTSRGLMNGVWTNQFDPDGTANRAMAVTVVWRMAGCPVGSVAGAFPDVPVNEWYSDAIDWAAGEKIVVGEWGNYRPFDPVSRQDLILILYRYAGSPMSDVSVLSYYNDYTQVSSYAANALAWAAELGIVTGDGTNLRPRESATRTELAALMMRYLTVTGQDPGEMPEEPDEPVDPDAPIDPDAPVVPVDPDAPVDPNAPAEPGESGEPAASEEPVEPIDPDAPDSEDKPADSDMVVNPVVPGPDNSAEAPLETDEAEN